jgi:hypothetical protein
MDIELFEQPTKKRVEGRIEGTRYADMPLKKEGWFFAWRRLYKTEGAEVYKLRLTETNEVKGLLMLTLMDNQMLYMNNVEVAPQRVDANSQYSREVGYLLAFACLKSFEQGRGAYIGYLGFECTPNLISFYRQNYGAVLVAGVFMYIPPAVGRKLIQTYLKLDI